MVMNKDEKAAATRLLNDTIRLLLPPSHGD